jgi:type II secretory pathway component PulF
MSAASKFRATRDAFYRDLAEAFAASESLYLFLARRREFCDEQGQSGMAELYEGMIGRMDESSNIADIVGDAVPAEDTLSLLSIDAAENDIERARMLRNLAASIRRRREMTKVLWKALSGPAIAAPIVLVMPVLSAFQMPMYEEMVPPSEWGFWGQIFYWVCYVIRTYWFVIAAGLVAGGVWFHRSFQNWSGPLRSRFDRHLPYSIYRDMAAAGFLTAMAEYMANKTPMVAALEALKERAPPWMAARIEATLDKLEEEPGNYAAAFNSGLLSPELHLRLVTYAERGNSRVSNSNDAFAEGLIQLGTDGLEHVAESVDKNAVWLTLVSTIVTVAVLVVFYGGNTAIGTLISDKFTQEADGLQLQSKGK